jgi:3-hydroxymyristoyl/3-hydroxydecanoyl-(acyl carrier protein) dehydratase
MRWDILEKLEVLKKGARVRALKSFSGQEDFFKENFPGKPLVPEPFFIEMIAQAGGVLYGLGLDFKKEVILAKIGEARFLKPVAPPCVFVIDAAIEEEREDGAWIAGTVKQNGVAVAEARILLAAVEGLSQNGHPQKQIVFSDQFLKHFDVLSIAKKSEGLN